MHAVAGETLERALVAEDDLATALVVVAQNRHHVLGLGGFGEGREAAQVAEHDDDSRRWLSSSDRARRRRRPAPRPAAPGSAAAGRRARFRPSGSRPAPRASGSSRQARAPAAPAGRLLLHGVVQRLDAQHGADPRHERRLIERLGQVIVAARLQPRHDVLRVGLGGDQDHRHEAQRGVGLQALDGRDAVELGHHDVEQDEIGQRARATLPEPPRRLGGDDLVALRLEAHPHDLEIRRQHRRRPGCGADVRMPVLRPRQESRTRRGAARGLKGLAT